MVASPQVSDRPALRRTLAVAIVLLLVGGVSSAYLRRGPQEVTVDDALARFRSSSATTMPAGDDPVVDAQAPTGDGAGPGAPAPDGAPVGAQATTAGPSGAAPSAAGPSQAAAPSQRSAQEGVYTYATKGYESTDAVGGARHDYPSETAMTVQRTSCGWMQRWQPLEERWEESEGCNEPGGFGLRRFTMYHEFFQRGVREDFACPPGAIVNPADTTVGRTWSFQCKSQGSTIDMTARLVGLERMTIGGRGVDAVHVEYVGRMTGANRGVQRQERWLERDTGLALRIVTEVDAEVSSPFGFVHYEERYTIDLLSMTPRR